MDIFVWISSVQFSLSGMSNSLRPHEPQHARPPCPSQLPEPTQTHVHRFDDAIQPSHPLSFPSPPVCNLSQHKGLFQRKLHSLRYNLQVLRYEYTHLTITSVKIISIFTTFKSGPMYLCNPSLLLSHVCPHPKNTAFHGL